MKRNFYKILGVSFFMALIFSSASIYALKKAVDQNPKAIITVGGKNVAVENLIVMDFDLEPGDITNYKDIFESYNFSEKTEFLVLKGIAANWEVTGTDASKISAVITGKIKTPEDLKLVEILNESGTVEIVTEQLEKKSRNIKVRIMVPKRGLSSLVIKTVSGDVDVKSLSLEKLDFVSVSGDFSAETLTAKQVLLSSVSADLELADIQIENFEGKSISGDLELQSMADFSGKWNSVSGDVEIKYAKVPQTSFKLKTQSGSISNRFGAPKEATSNIEVSIVSGDIKVE